ncbi:hypothetical protein AYI68_g3848 [Smittium mucronatum]|uniref:Uncharacterized protein n=1 Tax=Smittium mucronatum TaxID=133383 RepID=A0A1R0GYQ2_9FUNG|nr:hypothetical protein AYI68_g3848 [Smittium mucronatum]
MSDSLIYKEYRFSILGQYKTLKYEEDSFIIISGHITQGDIFRAIERENSFLVEHNNSLLFPLSYNSEVELVISDLDLEEIYNIKCGDLYLDIYANFSEFSQSTLYVQTYTDIEFIRTNKTLDYSSDYFDYISLNGVNLFDNSFNFLLIIDGRHELSSNDFIEESICVGSNEFYYSELFSFEMYDSKVFIKYGNFGYIGADESQLRIFPYINDNSVFLEKTDVKSVYKIRSYNEYFRLEFYKSSYMEFFGSSYGNNIQFYAY